MSRAGPSSVVASQATHKASDDARDGCDEEEHLPVAGLAAVTAYREPGFYDHINAVGERLYNALNALFERHGVDARAQGRGHASTFTSANRATTSAARGA